MTLVKIIPELTGVSETMLTTLKQRSYESKRDDSILKDLKAERIFEALDYDFERNFGTNNANYISCRAARFDQEICLFLDKNPDGVVVNLGEGLETQRYRIQSPYSLWITVDLPQAIRLREHFIEADVKHLHLAQSALDTSWADHIPSNKAVLILAQGLLMYFKENEVQTLLQEISEIFESSTLVFDYIPKWMSSLSIEEVIEGTEDDSIKSLKKYGYFRIASHWGIDKRELLKLSENFSLNHVVSIEDLKLIAFARGSLKWMHICCTFLGLFANMTPRMAKIEFKKSAL